MPLPACNPAYKYQQYFLTAGPRPVEGDYRKGLEDVIVKHYGDNISKMRIVQEVGNDGYLHFHAAIMLNRPARWPKLCQDIRKYVTNLGATESASCRFFYVRPGEDSKIIFDYITDPVKVKTTDLDSLEYKPRDATDIVVYPFESPADINYAQFLQYNHVCKKCKTPKPVFGRMCNVCDVSSKLKTRPEISGLKKF